MIRGMYTAASGMVANFRRQELITNNLANLSTKGYKQDLSTSFDFPSLLMAEDPGASGSVLSSSLPIGELGAGTELGEIQLDLSQGDLEETGKPLDLAISGTGFFAVQTPSGTLYTRNGEFSRDALGRLATADGGLVLGQDGPIQIGEGETLVDGDGTVSVDGQAVGRIRVVDFGPQETMLKVGNNYLAPTNPSAQEQAADAAAIDQGYLEHSNVDMTRATVEMLAAMRSYEASQRMLVLQDQTLDRAVNDIGKV